MRHIVLLVALLGVLSSNASAEPLRFAPLPLEDREVMVREFLGFVRYLSDQAGRRIELVHTSSYDELIKRFQRDEIDLAFIGPLPYLLINRQEGTARPLVRFKEPDGRDTYTCALTIFGDRLFDPALLAGRRLALPDPLSTCGEVTIKPLLREKGLDPARLEIGFFGQHDAVARAVVLDEADIGGMKSSMARRYRSLGLRIVAESPPVPGFALVANTRTVPEDVQARLIEALLSLPRPGTPEAASLMHSWHAGLRHGAVPASDGDFDRLRAALRDNAGPPPPLPPKPDGILP